LVRICRPLVATHHAVNRARLPCQLAKARRSGGVAILLGGPGPSSLIHAELGTSQKSNARTRNPRDYLCFFGNPKGLHGPEIFQRATSGCRQGVGLTLQLISGPTAHKAYEAHCTRLHCRHSEILKGMLAIFCKPRPPSQHRRPPTKRAKTKKNPG